MTNIGIIGGIGPESTIDYYRLILSKYRDTNQTDDNPQIIINSINMNKMLGFVFNQKYTQLVEYLAKEIKKLEKAGATFAALASNTPHIVFDELKEKSNLPLISIVEETCKHIQKSGLKKVGLFGTKSTMNSGFYQKKARNYNIDISIPSQEQQDFIHEKYLGELVKAIVNPQTKNEFKEIVEIMRNEDNLQGLILGGTELPYIFNENDFENFILINTTDIHVQSIVKYAIDNKVI